MSITEQTLKTKPDSLTGASLAAEPGDSLTVLNALKDLAKRWRSDGTIKDFDEGKNFAPKTVAVSSIGELSRLLTKLEGKRRSCIIRGRSVGMDEAAKREDLERDGYVFRRKSLFEDQPLRTVLIEVDDFEPITADPVTDPQQAIAEYIAAKLPEPFRRASYHWQLSNSAGHPSKPGLRVHIWFYLAEPRTCAALKSWAKDVALPADHSVFDEIQIHYTSAPLFDDGVADPVPVRSGFHAGETDEVVIDIPDLPPGESSSVGRRKKALEIASDDPIAQHLNANSFVLGEPRDGKLPIVCPFEADHTADTGPTSTVYLLPNFNGYPRGQFQCLHAHCVDRTRGDFLHAIGYEAADDFDNLVDVGDATEDAALLNPKPARPRIKMKPGKLHVYAKQLEKLLSAELYERDHRLVRIAGAVELTGDTRKVTRNDAQPVILEAGAEFVIRRSGEIADLVAYRKRENEWASVDCSAALARNIVGQKSWSSMRPLTAIASAPFIRPDMTVCMAPGYDETTGVFYTPNAEFQDVPESPTQRQAAEALAVLLAPFDEFPFVSEAGRAAFASNILTEAVRLAVDNVPVFTYNAPEAATGKTLLAEMPARIVHGMEPAKRAWAEGDELRKVLFASLLVGDRSILFDNAKRGVKVRAPVLCGFATAPMYSDRKLGVSEVPTMPNRAVVSMTGNNITPTGDLARRSVVIRQVADGDTVALRGRRFKIRDLKGYVSAHRAELLTAALTVVRAFAVAGCPEQSVPLPSFEQWSRLARDPLLWLGLADPIETQADETDDEAAPLSEAFAVLGDALRGREFSVGELVELCFGIADDGELRKALERAGCSDAEDPTKVRYWLRDCRDREAGGWKLERTSGRKARNATWKFVQKVAGSDLL